MDIMRPMMTEISAQWEKYLHELLSSGTINVYDSINTCVDYNNTLKDMMGYTSDIHLCKGSDEMKSKYEVGDTVTIIKDLENHRVCNGVGVGHTMRQFAGQSAKITRETKGLYRLDIDEQQFAWTDGMFENKRYLVEY